MVLLHAFSSVFLAVTQVYCFNRSWLSAYRETLKSCCTYLAFLFTSMSIYRVFFQRLCGFPGPILARASKSWHFAHCLDSKNHILLERLRQQIGDFVRTDTLIGVNALRQVDSITTDS